MTRLTRATLDQLAPAIPSPRGRPEPNVGIVHFGPGAFHRAHQAAYVDTVLQHDPRWGIAAVSMRSRGTVEALERQDGLYTLAIRDAEPAMRVSRHYRGADGRLLMLAISLHPPGRFAYSMVLSRNHL